MDKVTPVNSSKDKSGQAVTEYILLLAVTVGFASLLLGGLKRVGLADKLAAPIRKDFAKSYQYGHPKASGYDDGGPQYHMRAVEGGTNFRIFYLQREK